MIKNITIVILIGLCLYMYLNPKVEIRETLPEAAKILVNTEVKRVEEKIDSQGFTHAVISEVENVVSDYQFIRDSARAEFDSVVRLLNIDRKNFKEYMSVNGSWRDSFLMAKAVNDSVFKYVSPSLKIDFVNKKDTPYFNYSYDAKINYAEYWRKEHFLAPKRHYIDFWIEDAKATINGVKRIKIQPEEKGSFKVKATGQYYRSPQAGLEAVYDKGGIGVGGGYMYDFDTREWYPGGKITFDILSF